MQVIAVTLWRSELVKRRKVITLRLTFKWKLTEWLGRILSGRRGKESLYNLFTEQVEVLVKIQRIGVNDRD
jgi:hypothetical protein